MQATYQNIFYFLKEEGEFVTIEHFWVISQFTFGLFPPPERGERFQWREPKWQGACNLDVIFSGKTQL